MNVLKFGKKVLTVSTVFSTILWSVGVSALVPAMAQAATCPTFKAGDLIKVTGRAAIYAVDANGKVLYFPSGDEFKSWNVNDSYGGYTSISQTCYDALPVPSAAPMGVNFRAGSYVVKRPSSDQLYVVEPGNLLAKITPDAAKALYGTNYKVKTVADVFWTNYTGRGADITEAKAHAGMFVSNGGKTYYVNNDGTLSEVTSTGLSANRVKTAFVHPLASLTGYTVSSVVVSAETASVSDRTQTGVASSNSGTGTTTTGGNVTVALAADNAPANILASNTSFNPVLKITLTAGSQAASITGLTLRKSGYAANTTVSGVDVVDASGVRHGNVASSINSDNNVSLLFSSTPVNIPANSSQTLTVRVNLSDTATAGTIQFALVGPSSVTSNGTVGGSFPVTGNVFTLQSGSSAVATVKLDEQGVNVTGATLNVDANNEQDIAKFSVQEYSSNENVAVKSLTLYNNGTAADSDVADVQLVAQDGTVLATAQQSSKTVVFNLATPYNIDKGTTKNFTVRAKIINGAGRTIQFVVYNNYDLVVTGSTTGASVLPAAGSTDTAFPIGDLTGTCSLSGISGACYNMVKIGSGTLSFNKDVTSPSTAVTPGSNNVVLGKWFAKPTGEDMELRTVGLTIASTTGPVLTGSVTIKVNGASVWSGALGQFSGGQATLTLSSYPILTAGQNNYVTVESNVLSGATNGATVLATLDLFNVKRLVTNDIVDAAVNNVPANTLSIQAGALRVTTLATPVAQSLVAGSTNVVLGQFELSAGVVSSGEDVKVSKIMVTSTKTVSAAYTDIGNLVLYDANGNALATTASTATGAQNNAFTFVNPIVVPKAGTIVLTLKGDVLTRSGAGTLAYSANAAGITAVGVSTGNTITATDPTTGYSTGQQMTLAASGQLMLSTVTGGSAAPANDQNVVVAATAVPVFAFKLTALNEPIKITSLKLTASGTLTTVNDLVNLKLYKDNDTVPFASAGQMTAGASTASTSYTWNATDNLLPAAVQPGTPVTIYVKADIGAAGSVVLGDKYRFSIASSSDVGAKGASSGTVLSNPDISGTPTTVSSFSYIAPFGVTVAADAPTGNQTQAIVAGTQLARVKVTNNGSSKVTIKGLKFTNSGSTGSTTTTYKMYYSDQNSSNYTGYTASSTMGSVDFSNLATYGGTTFTIDGGAYRYVTVVINTIGSAVSGDTWQLSVASLGDVVYTVAESDLGYDATGNGVLTDSTANLYADGKPSLATLTKQ